MKVQAVILISVACLTLSACGAKSTQENTNRTSDVPVSPDGNDPYFDAFASTQNGSCAVGNAVFSALSSDPILIGKDGHGRDILAGLYVHLSEKGTFEARYIEYHVTEYLKDVSGFAHSPKFDRFQIIRGAWSVRNDAIYFEDLGSGDKAAYNDQKAIAFHLDRIVISDGVVDKTLFLRKGWSTWDFVRDSDPCAPTPN